MLQQTVNSARSTLQNLEKITSDLDELTGDPQFRSSLRVIITALGQFLATTQQLEEQVQAPGPGPERATPPTNRPANRPANRSEIEPDVDVRFER
jgi:phospholipid/cholesterol/gamma-HCH transport system substrate-binding protein